MIEQLNDQELDQINGGHHGASIRISVSNSFNTGGTRVGDVSIRADDSRVSITIGSTGGLVIG